MFEDMTSEMESDLDPREAEALESILAEQLAKEEQAEYDAEAEALDNNPQSNNKQKGENHE